MKINNICVVTPIYPMNGNIERGAFVATLVKTWQELDVNVKVIAPTSYPLVIKAFFNRSHDFLKPPADKLLTPRYMSFSGYFTEIEKESFRNSVIRQAKNVANVDIYYGKFLLTGAEASTYLGLKNSKPVIADLGESKLLELIDSKHIERTKKLVTNISGAVVVSERLKNEIMKLGMDEDNILLLPNGVDSKQFQKLDKIECRKILSLPQDKFIVISVGYFTERKGTFRILEAMNKINKADIVGIFLGGGKTKPQGDNVLFSGSISHNDIQLWLNAADVFVLPTLAEGNSNAINEAMACGLPIISSRIPDVETQVNEKNAILVNPRSVQEIAIAINTLYENSEKKKSMSLASLDLAKSISINTRAKTILKWMEKFIKNH